MQRKECVYVCVCTTYKINEDGSIQKAKSGYSTLLNYSQAIKEENVLDFL